jgi:sucrose-6-phosphate hydrolase SacC (GH32 family)
MSKLTALFGAGLVVGLGLALEEAAAEPARYQEPLRPQFHFTARSGWLNDPNGLVFHDGTYHLFFQHNPFGTEWGNMTWGHAVSRDLVRWQQQSNALEPDRLGTMFSGSAVVDWNNSAGFGGSGAPALVLIYTAAGGTSEASKGQPFTQCLAWSTNNARTVQKYGGNPVLPNISEGNRDPKVLWHAPTQRWIMALYVDVPDSNNRDAQGKPKLIQTIQFFASADLKAWTYLSRLDGFFECPDLFELPVEGAAGVSKWVVFAADGAYVIGGFDGRVFIPESSRHTGDWGANFYAAQTYSDIPARDGRRILIGWMRGGTYPGMPFNQQMTFPASLTLRDGPGGLRLCKWPVRELETLRDREASWAHRVVTAATPVNLPMEGELFDLEAEVEPGTSQEFGFELRGTWAGYSVADGKLSCLGRTAELAPENGRVRLRVLLDRTSIELFGNGGWVTMSSCFLPPAGNRRISFVAKGGEARLVSLAARTLKSAWADAGSSDATP